MRQKPQKAQREVIKRLKALGIDADLHGARRHQKLVASKDGRTIRVSISSSPRVGEASIRNAVTQVQRALEATP